MALRTELWTPLPVEQYDRLSPNHQRLARFVSENPSIVAFASASEIGRQVEMSTATVVRFAQALGFSGYPEFQESVRRSYLRTLQPLDALETLATPRRDLFELQLYRDLDNLRRSMHALHLDGPLLIELARQINQANEIVIAATGADASLAMVLGYYLRLMGYRAIAEIRGGPHLVEAVTPLQRNDLLLGVEFGSEASDLADALAWAAKRGILTASFTDLDYAAIARVAAVSIVFPSEGVSFFRSLVAPLSIIQGLIAHLVETADAPRRRLLTEALRGLDMQRQTE